MAEFTTDKIGIWFRPHDVEADQLICGAESEAPVDLGADSLPFVRASPKRYTVEPTLWALNLLCGVSKQQVAPIPAEGHLSARNGTAYLK